MPWEILIAVLGIPAGWWVLRTYRRRQPAPTPPALTPPTVFLRPPLALETQWRVYICSFIKAGRAIGTYSRAPMIAAADVVWTRHDWSDPDRELRKSLSDPEWRVIVGILKAAGLCQTQHPETRQRGTFVADDALLQIWTRRDIPYPETPPPVEKIIMKAQSQTTGETGLPQAT